jgi:hypothetical protein
MPIGSQRMPIGFELLFLSIAITLLLTSSVRSWRHHREWKRNQNSNSRSRFRLPLSVRLENSLFMLAAMICFAVATPDWRLRAFFGGVTLLGIGLTIYRLKSQSKDKPSFDESSILHLGPTGTHPPLS